jgi:anti-sigma regulatory factor (Ser/Thr protein kinase)
MKTIEKVFKYLNDNKSASGADIAQYLGISRQAVNRHLKSLIQEGMVQKEGNTKAAVYFPSGSKLKKVHIKSFKKIYKIKNLKEDTIFLEIVTLLNLKKYLRQNIFEIIQYAFTEMLNNAIDHSKSDKCFVEVIVDPYNIQITIRDYGIGIFYSIFKKYEFNDEYEAVGELLKGKTTTMKERHSGEGIFFTSKAVEISSFRSHKTNLIFNNSENDIFIEQEKFIHGTLVKLQIGRNSKKNLSTVFNQFAPEEYEFSFQRTKVFIKLYLQSFISRSEARRLLTGLNKFREIILDFKDVTKIGQGFADEIFRVFQIRYPNIIIKTENVSPTIRQMIKHVVDNNYNI